jgi:peptidoglycan hydrolase CwlO-like protein
MNKTTTKLKIKTKIISIILMSTMISSCATKNAHKQTALKIIQNNNAILKEIKKDRTNLHKQEQFSKNKDFK